jgi:anti-sigma regulatory factor (Ser/Thr protein kinase)
MASDTGPEVEANAQAIALFDRAQAARDAAADLTVGVMRRARFRLRLSCAATENTPRTTREAVARLAHRAGATATELEAVRLVVSEGVTNVVQHAYGEEPGMVYLDAAVIGGRLTILIADDGRGPHEPSPHPGLGVGWKAVAQLADRFTVLHRGTGGTELQIRMRVTAAP